MNAASKLQEVEAALFVYDISLNLGATTDDIFDACYSRQATRVYMHLRRHVASGNSATIAGMSFAHKHELW